MKRCAIIAGGDYTPIRTREDEFVIACDRGYEYACREGIRPGLILGDFDSYSGALPGDIRVERFKKEKDDTDTMLAIRYALEQGYDALRICCAFGGRLDHLYANIQSLAFAVKHGMQAWAEDERNYMTVLLPGEHRLEARPGWSLSLFALGDKVENLSISGAKYELSGGQLDCSFPLGVSNEFSGDVGIGFDSGMLLVICCSLEGC